MELWVLFNCEVFDFFFFNLWKDEKRIGFLLVFGVIFVGFVKFEFEFDFLVVLGDGGCRLFE